MKNEIESKTLICFCLVQCLEETWKILVSDFFPFPKQLFSVQTWLTRQSRQFTKTFSSRALTAGIPAWEPQACPSIPSPMKMLQYLPLCSSECCVWFLNEWSCFKHWFVVFVWQWKWPVRCLIVLWTVSAVTCDQLVILRPKSDMYTL